MEESNSLISNDLLSNGLESRVLAQEEKIESLSVQIRDLVLDVTSLKQQINDLPQLLEKIKRDHQQRGKLHQSEFDSEYSPTRRFVVTRKHNSREESTGMGSNTSIRDDSLAIKHEPVYQKGSTEEYIEDFEVYSTKIPHQSEARLLRMFQQGLRPVIRTWVQALAPSTYEEAKKTALQVQLVTSFNGNRFVPKTEEAMSPNSVASETSQAYSWKSDYGDDKPETNRPDSNPHRADNPVLSTSHASPLSFIQQFHSISPSNPIISVNHYIGTQNCSKADWDEIQPKGLCCNWDQPYFSKQLESKSCLINAVLKCWVFGSADNLFDGSPMPNWAFITEYTKLCGVLHANWGHKPCKPPYHMNSYDAWYALCCHKSPPSPKPPDYTQSIRPQRASHTFVNKPLDFVSFFGFLQDHGGHQFSNPHKTPDCSNSFPTSCAFHDHESPKPPDLNLNTKVMKPLHLADQLFVSINEIRKCADQKEKVIVSSLLETNSQAHTVTVRTEIRNHEFMFGEFREQNPAGDHKIFAHIVFRCKGKHGLMDASLRNVLENGHEEANEVNNQKITLRIGASMLVSVMESCDKEVYDLFSTKSNNGCIHGWFEIGASKILSDKITTAIVLIPAYISACRRVLIKDVGHIVGWTIQFVKTYECINQWEGKQMKKPLTEAAKKGEGELSNCKHAYFSLSFGTIPVVGSRQIDSCDCVPEEGYDRSSTLKKIFRVAKMDYRKIIYYCFLGNPDYIESTSSIRKYLNILAEYQIIIFLRSDFLHPVSAQLKGMATPTYMNLGMAKGLVGSALLCWVLEFLRRQLKWRTFKALILDFHKYQKAYLLLLAVGVEVLVGMSIWLHVRYEKDFTHSLLSREHPPTHDISKNREQGKHWMIAWKLGTNQDYTREDFYSFSSKLLNFRLEDKPCLYGGGID